MSPTSNSQQKSEVRSVDKPLTGEVFLVVIEASALVQRVKCVLDAVQCFFFVSFRPQPEIK